MRPRKRDGEVGGTGLEPIAATDYTASTSGNQLTPSGAESGAVGARMALSDPDLMAIVNAWPGLPEAARRQIVDLIQTANVGNPPKTKQAGSE
jgi:hypothetical protein